MSIFGTALKHLERFRHCVGQSVRFLHHDISGEATNDAIISLSPSGVTSIYSLCFFDCEKAKVELVTRPVTCQNEEAEELMRKIEKEEEQLAYEDPDKKVFHLCIVNLVIGKFTFCRP